MKPPIWFERPILPGLIDQVADAVTVLGASLNDASDELAGALGALAGVRSYDAALMDRAPRLLGIARTGIGVDSVDLAAATARGIAVCNAPDGPTVSTAEHAVMLLLMAAKRTTVSVDRLRAGEDDMYARNEAIELMGKTIGVVGYGRIARRVAAACRGLGMQVAVFDPYVADIDDDVRRTTSLEDLLGSVDAVSVHVPLNGDTHHLFGVEAFGAMRPGAIFVNTARGGLVDQDALLEAIDSGHLFAAGLDVTEPEPLPMDHPLLRHPHVIVTPHVASGTAQGKLNNFTMALEQLIDIAEGRKPPNLVNPEVWPHVVRRRQDLWGAATSNARKAGNT